MLLASSDKSNLSSKGKVNKYSLIGINSISPSYVSSISHIKLIDKKLEKDYAVKIINSKLELIKALFEIPHFIDDFLHKFNQTKTSIIKVKFLFELSKYVSDNKDDDIDGNDSSEQDVIDISNANETSDEDQAKRTKKKNKKNIFNNIHVVMNTKIKCHVVKIQNLLNKYKTINDVAEKQKILSEIGDIFCSIHLNEKHVKNVYRYFVDTFKAFEHEYASLNQSAKSGASVFGMRYEDAKAKYISVRDAYRNMLMYTERMILANLRLVISVSKRYTNKKIDFMDIVQEGNLGLIKAIKKFDYTKGYKFSTYATWWIQQSITRDIYDNYEAVRIPIHMKENISKIHKSCMNMSECLSYDEKIKEISKNTLLDEKKIKKVFKIQRGCINIDKLAGLDIGDEDVVDFVDKSNNRSPFYHVLAKDKLKMIDSMIDTHLNDREAKIFRMRYLEKGADGSSMMTLEIIGYLLGITRERVRQILNNAHSKLNKAAKNNMFNYIY